MDKLVNSARKDGNWDTNGAQYVATTIKEALTVNAKSVFQADRIGVDMTKERAGKTIFAASLYKVDAKTGAVNKFKGIIGHATAVSNTKNSGSNAVYEHSLSIEYGEG